MPGNESENVMAKYYQFADLEFYMKRNYPSKVKKKQRISLRHTKLREITSKLALQEMLKEILQEEEK